MKCPPLFSKFTRHAARTEEWLLCLILSFMIVLACVQIILRDLFSSGLIWADPLLRYMVLWAGLIGASVATRKGKHISIDIASHLIPKKAVPWFRLIVDIFSGAVCVFLTYASILFIRSEIEFGGGRVLLGLPSWALNLIFPIAFSLIALRFIIMAMESLRKIVGFPSCRAIQAPDDAK